MDEVDVDPVDLGRELRKRVELRLGLAPVVLGRPVAGQLLDRRQLNALRPICRRAPWWASASPRCGGAGRPAAPVARRRWKGRISVAVSTVVLMTTSCSHVRCRATQRTHPLWNSDPARCSLGLNAARSSSENRLGEVAALVDFVEVDEVGVRLLGPAPRRLILLAGKDGHRNGDGDALGVEEATLVLPIETRRGDPRVRQPVERDVVEDLVTGQFARVARVPVQSSDDCRGRLAVGIVVVEEPGGQADG